MNKRARQIPKSTWRITVESVFNTPRRSYEILAGGEQVGERKEERGWENEGRGRGGREASKRGELKREDRKQETEQARRTDLGYISASCAPIWIRRSGVAGDSGRDAGRSSGVNSCRAVRNHVRMRRWGRDRNAGNMKPAKIRADERVTLQSTFDFRNERKSAHDRERATWKEIEREKKKKVRERGTSDDNLDGRWCHADASGELVLTRPGHGENPFIFALKVRNRYEIGISTRTLRRDICTSFNTHHTRSPSLNTSDITTRKFDEAASEKSPLWRSPSDWLTNAASFVRDVIRVVPTTGSFIPVASQASDFFVDQHCFS